MPQISAVAFYLGPYAIYPTSTGLQDPITLLPEQGGYMLDGNYVDLSTREARQWNIKYGNNLYPGRLRFVQLSINAIAANIYYGAPVGWALGQYVDQVTVRAGGTGYTNGTFTIASTAAGGTAASAVVTVAGGIITSAQLTYPGANMTSVPTFSLSELTGGSGGSVVALQHVSPNFVSSFDSSCGNLSDVRGICLATSITSAQVTAGSYIVIQEEGIAVAKVTTATATAAGSVATAGTGATVTTTVSTGAPVAGFIGYTLDTALAGGLTRVSLRLAQQQG